MNRIVVNGKDIVCNGNNVSIMNNKVFVNGKEVSDKATKNCDVYIYGDVEHLECEGSVQCNNVKGNIQAGGSVNCDDVGGNINCGGSCNCDDVKRRCNSWWKYLYVRVM